jgi:hypothetical protein
MMVNTMRISIAKSQEAENEFVQTRKIIPSDTDPGESLRSTLVAIARAVVTTNGRE